MTINYLDSKRLQGLSADTKPTNVQTNSIFIETDTAKRYWYNGTLWKLNLDSDFNFSSATGWVNGTNGGVRYNVANGVLNLDAMSEGVTDNRIYYDLGGSVSDTAWVMRFKLVINNYVQGAQPQHLSYSMSLCKLAVAGNVTNSFIGFHHASNNSVNYNTSQDALNGSQEGSGTGTNFSATPSAGTFYIQIRRMSATQIKVAIFSNSTYTTLTQELTETCDAGIVDLRYIQMCSHTSQIAGSARWSGTIDDLVFRDGVTSI